MVCKMTTQCSPSFLATTVTTTLIASYLLRATALRVTRPTEDEVITAERPYTVGWEGALDSAKFEVDLHYCGAYSLCFEDDCGVYLQSLCPEGVDCQPAMNGDADVIFPEPLDGVSSSGYRVRIKEVGGGPLDVACSEDFILQSSYDAQHTVGEGWVLGDPSIWVISPFEGAVALAGETYTVEFDYDRRYGEGAKSFKIDLYSLEGTGDCGGWITSICDKPDTGCPEFHGDYDVVIPAETSTGTYRIRVGVFGDDSVFGCSEPFQILDGGDALWDFN